MRASLTSLAIAASLVLAVNVGHADADTVPPAILLATPPASGCASPELQNRTEQLTCTLLRSHPAVLCFAATEASLGCPTSENLRACTEFANVSPEAQSVNRREATQCMLRRPDPHFIDPTAR